MFIKLGRVIAVAVTVAVAGGCATNNGYQKAFSAESAIKGNHQSFSAPLEQTFRAVKMTLVRQGFTVESADLGSGLIKAVRNFQDPTDKDVSYNIIATADVTADDENSLVTMAASQQTVLHREWHTWWHLLWIIPLFPTGTEYQTVVTQEGNVTDPVFYKDFFASVDTTVAANLAAIKAKAEKLAAEKAAAEKAAAEKEAAEKAAAEKAAEEKAAAETAPVAANSTEPTDKAPAPVEEAPSAANAPAAVTP